MISKLQDWLQTLPLLSPHEFREIHIDVLSPEFKDPITWIPGMMKCLEEAITSASFVPSQGILCAAFALVGGDDYVGINYQSCEELSQQFGLTPPSLYYFGKNAIPWHDPAQPFKRVNVSDFPIDLRQWVLQHLEYLHENEPEYRRSLWVSPLSVTDI
jgi:hypothetical protein